MNNFRFYAPTEVCFGKKTVEKTGELARKYGAKNVLIHYGGGSAVRSGLIARVEKSLDEQGIRHVSLGGVVPNPRISKVYEGIELCRKENVDFILAVGGGSVIDSSKAIAYGLANEGDVWDLFAHTKTATACFPIGTVLTIAAAGSEMSNSCVITNEATADKRAYDDDLSRPKFSIMDPELTMTLPDYQTACGCTDIMMHTEERYFANNGSMEITDSIAEALLRTVIENAQILRKNPLDYDARAEVMWAGSLAHNGLTGCGNDGGDFASHMLEHEVGGMFDVAHGAGLAAIWPSWARYVYKNCLPKFKRFALNVMGVEENGTDEEIAMAGIEAMEAFYHSISMPINFAELGIDPTEEQIKEMAARCVKATGGNIGSAKVLYEEDMIAIYKMAARK